MSRRVKTVAQGLSFLEGPRWRNGLLYASDFYTHRVLTFDHVGLMETLCVVPEQPSGLGFAPDGTLIIVSMKNQRLLRLVKGKLEVFADLSGVAKFHCNDMLVDASGRAYVGNFGWNPAETLSTSTTVLALVQPDGSVSVAADGLVFPNGIVQTADGKTLLVAETFAARISAFDVDQYGSLSNRRVWASFSDRPFSTIREAVSSGVPLPDGMALDVEGALWIGDAAGSGALRVAAGGEILEKIDTAPSTVFALALGGRERRTLYMCASPPLFENDPVTDHRASLMCCEVSIAGAGLP